MADGFGWPVIGVYRRILMQSGFEAVGIGGHAAGTDHVGIGGNFDLPGNHRIARSVLDFRLRQTPVRRDGGPPPLFVKLCRCQLEPLHEFRLANQTQAKLNMRPPPEAG